MQCLRAHVCVAAFARAHECARVCMSPSINSCRWVRYIKVYIRATASVKYRYARACGCIASMCTCVRLRVLTMRPLTTYVCVSAYRYGSARRCLHHRRRSARTSAHGTPRRSPRCTTYAPLLAGGAPPQRARSVGAWCGAALVRDRTTDAHMRTYSYSLPRVSTCVHRAARREDGMRQYI